MRRLFLPLFAIAFCACGPASNSKSDAGSGDAGGNCPSGWTTIDGGCVNLMGDPDNCGSLGHACSATNASPACVMGACTVDTCKTGWADCDSMPQNGCEVNLTDDPMNCGACTNACTPANGVASCVASNCAIASCNAGYADCDENPINGCETNTMTNPYACGGCGKACLELDGGTDGGADAGPVCVMGTCQ